MKVYLDSADLGHIRQAKDLGLLEGVMPSPDTLSTDNPDRVRSMRLLCKEFPGPVFVDLPGASAEAMLTEARELVKIGHNVVISAPATLEGLKVIKTLGDGGIETNATQVHSPQLALLAAKSGAAYISLSVYRLNGGGQHGMQTLQDCVSIFRNFKLSAQLVATDLQNATQFGQAALLGADAAAIHMGMLISLVENPLSNPGSIRASNA